MARTTKAKKQPEAHKIDGVEIFAALKELEKSQGIPIFPVMVIHGFYLQRRKSDK